MNKVVSIIAALAAIGSAAVSYITVEEKNKQTVELSEVKDNLSKKEKDLSDTKKNLAETQKNLDQTKKDLDSTQAGKKAAETELEKSKAQAKGLEGEVAQLKSKLEQVEQAAKKFEEINAKLGGKDPEQLAKQIEDAQKEAEDVKGQLKVKEDELAATKSQVAKLEAEIEAKRKGGATPPGLNAKVLAVNAQWNFIVINAGKDKSVIENSELIVVRGGQPIAKVKIAQVDETTAVADVIKELRPNAKLAVGDMVISK